MIDVEAVTKVVPSGDGRLTILSDVTLRIPSGQVLAVTGPSGSGKSTLLGLIAGLDRPTAGEVVIDGQRLSALDEDQVARFRGRTMGVVFQTFHLIPTLTALENVQIPLELAGAPDPRRRAAAILDRVGLAPRSHHHPSHLSGGEQQRVAIARAFAAGGSVLLADEPTGSLDTHSGNQVMELILELNHERGTTLVLVTHNPDLCGRAHRVVTLVDGRITQDRTLLGSAPVTPVRP